MKFGVREICDVVFKAKSNTKIGNMPVVAGQPVLYIDSAKTSTIEGAATTVYAQGGRGNARLIAWEGEKTLTVSYLDKTTTYNIQVSKKVLKIKNIRIKKKEWSFTRAIRGYGECYKTDNI